MKINDFPSPCSHFAFLNLLVLEFLLPIYGDFNFAVFARRNLFTLVSKSLVMKVRALFFLLSLIIISSGFSTKARILQEGTIVRIKVNENLDSRVSKVGDMVNLEVVEDVMIGNFVAIKRGSKATGRITEAVPAKWAGQKGKLDFEIDYVKAVGDRNVKVRATNSSDGKSRMSGVIAAAAIINPLLLVIKGKDVTIPKDQIFNTYVDKDYNL